jgi:hypothetical protein
MTSRQRTLPLPNADADELVECDSAELLRLCERAKATGTRVVALRVKGARYWATVRKSPAAYVPAEETGHMAQL